MFHTEDPQLLGATVQIQSPEICAPLCVPLAQCFRIITTLDFRILGCGSGSLGTWFPTFRRKCRLQNFFMDLEPLKMKASLSFESSGITYPPTQRLIPADGDLLLHRCKSLTTLTQPSYFVNVMENSDSFLCGVITTFVMLSSIHFRRGRPLPVFEL